MLCSAQEMLHALSSLSACLQCAFVNLSYFFSRFRGEPAETCKQASGIRLRCVTPIVPYLNSVTSYGYSISDVALHPVHRENNTALPAKEPSTHNKPEIL